MALTSCRSTFLTLLGAVYWCAFVSYYVQYPGLLGEDGLLPTSSYWDRVRSSREQQDGAQGSLDFDLELPLGWWTQGLLQGGAPRLPTVTLPPGLDGPRLRGFLDFPTWLWFLPEGLHVDQAMDLIALSGVALAGLAVLGVHHVSVFLLLYLNYLSLFLLGQRWLGFQWDIFILETGAMALLYCPFGSRKAKAASPPGAWLLRVLIAKFMYMNGVVKVTANCPTWKHLTALEYHFASTCLPTSEAWIHHQLPPFILRMGVAVMFLVELPLPFLLVFPVVGIRRFGVLAQAALQMGIIATGNYNWFNVHTIALLLPAWDAECDGCDDDDDGGGGGGGGGAVDDAGSGIRQKMWRCMNCVPSAWGRFWRSRVGLAVAFAVACAGSAWAFVLMFEVQNGGPTSPAGGSAVAGAAAPLAAALPAFEAWTVKARFGERDVRAFSSRLLSPTSLAAFFVLVGASCLRWALAPLAARRRSLLWAVPRVAGRTLKVVLLMPALVLCLLPLQRVHPGVDTAIPFASSVELLEQALANWHVAQSYGLFRQMTGVGTAAKGAVGWGGLPPSVVAVDGVVVEGSDDGDVWREIPFRYALGSERRQPRRTAPHQPRLDWQMWFAALGSYQHNDWFVHLMYKVLTGSEAALALLDVDESPWVRGSAPPRLVRAWLYHYDFTRLDTPWARSIPGARILNLSSTEDRSLWWTRQQVQQYLPAVGEAELKGVAKSKGWPVGKARLKALRRARNCSSAAARSMALGRGCAAAVALRGATESLSWTVGWHFQTGVFQHVWPGAAEQFFLDVHFVVIVVPLLALLVLRGCKKPAFFNLVEKLKQE